MKSMGLLLAAMAMSNGINGGPEMYIEPKETEEERKKRLTKAEIEINKANGLKEFFYRHNSVWALNQKSADKKAKKKGWI